MAIIYNKRKIRLAERKISVGRAEILCTNGKLPRSGRKIVTFGVYLPPRTRAERTREIMESLSNEISKAKTELNDPIIILGGDFNKKPFQKSFEDFPDMKIIHTGPTRKDETLDYVISNIPDATAYTRDPLESEDGQLKSDHRTIVATASVNAEDRFKWIKIKYRPRTKKGDTIFHKWITENKWESIRSAADLNQKTSELVSEFDKIMLKAYPITYKKIRNSDDPWITHNIRKKIKARRREFEKSKKRTPKWKEMKKATDKMIKEAKQEYYQKFTKLALESGDMSLYYRVVNRIKDSQAPTNFCVTDLYPDKPPEEVAELVADFFCEIGQKFDPLTPVSYTHLTLPTTPYV